jgi:hypothetical protein
MERETGHSHGPEIAKPEMLQKEYPILVVDPYALNIIDQGPRMGEARLSFYSAFVARAARKMIEDGRLGLSGKVVLFADASFGPNFASVGSLIRDYLTRERPGGPIISPDRIVFFEGQDMNQTSTQVKKLSEYLKKEGLKNEEVAYLGFDYHRQRVLNHAKGFHVNAKYLTAEYVHAVYEPNFDANRFYSVLPFDEIEKVESFRRRVSRFDKKGIIPRITKPILGGSYMLDNVLRADGTLGYEYKPGKKKLKELGIVPVSKDLYLDDVVYGYSPALSPA